VTVCAGWIRIRGGSKGGKSREGGEASGDERRTARGFHRAESGKFSDWSNACRRRSWSDLIGVGDVLENNH